jgi:imidazolonepropionase-like amidohydrolase
MTAAVRVARQRGFKTMVHANGKTPVKIALDAGCDSIEHGFFMGVENLHQMADSRTTWVPTAYTMLALKQRMKDRGQEMDVAQKNFDHQVEQIQMARELGVRIALGTDAGSAGVQHGQALVQEMRVYREAGFSVEQVVACATHNAAMLLELPEAGRLKPNMQASLIAVRGDPSQLPESLGAIEKLIYKGKQLNITSGKPETTVQPPAQKPVDQPDGSCGGRFGKI